jgi:flavin reductase (DIM6/NTAB) family NADH-FMN oxidoreductase RutF
MITITPAEFPLPVFHDYMLSAIAPRPIAFVSTQDTDGCVNLSPFSFFNAFGSNPPIVVFSPARSGRTGQTKDTFDNVKAVPQCVINICDYALVHQLSLASGEYPKGVNEFEKAGLTALPSQTVKPPRVAEAPIQMECEVLQILETGTEGGAGNLVICRVNCIHIRESVLDKDNRIDPYRMDYIARMGRNFYARIIPESIFEVPKPAGKDNLGIGFDNLPDSVRHSSVLTGNELAQLASVSALPSVEAVTAFRSAADFSALHSELTDEQQRHRLAAAYIRAGDIQRAWLILLA